MQRCSTPGARAPRRRSAAASSGTRRRHDGTASREDIDETGALLVRDGADRARRVDLGRGAVADAYERQYCREIEAYLCRKNDGHLVRIVGPAFEQVCGWAAQACR